MRLAMMIDLERCIGCRACVTACKERWDTGPGAQRCWVNEYEHGRRGKDLAVSFYPGLCMQCAEHPCTQDCPTGATYRDEKTGVIVVDKDICIGCGNCISTCPYGARTHDASQGVIEKCDLCLPYLERGEPPACVQTCLANCRHVGDLDDPEGELRARIERTGAQPLVIAEVNVGPATTYSGERDRAIVLQQVGVLERPQRSWLTRAWSGYTRPFAVFAVPAIGAAVMAGGLVVNLIGRRMRNAAPEPSAHAPDTPAADGPAPGGIEAGAAEAAQAPEKPATLPRHRAGMRFLHWFNLLSWIVLLFTGTALISAESFALFGQDFPRWVREHLGGADALILAHVVWGLVWAAVIVPLFLLFKRGGIEALREILLTRDDLQWILRKPFDMLGVGKKPLPPQDKYNAGQKVFALSALAGTATIILTGLVMTFHIGPTWVVAAAVLLHKLAVAFALLGLALHVTMAVIVSEERPALWSMITGYVDREHAEHHSDKWVRELDEKDGERT